MITFQAIKQNVKENHPMFQHLNQLPYRIHDIFYILLASLFMVIAETMQILCIRLYLKLRLVSSYDGLPAYSEIHLLPDNEMIFLRLFTTIFFIIIFIGFMHFIEKRSFFEMGLSSCDIKKQYTKGLIIGTVLFLSVFLLAMLLHSVEIISFQLQVLPGLFFIFIGYMIQGMSEEIMMRGFLMTSISRNTSITFGIFMNSAIFSYLHGENASISWLAYINIFLFGILMSLYVLKSGNLWGVAAIHSAWNFVQGNVFGIHVSGQTSGSSIFTIRLLETKQHVTGGNFGLEDSVITTAVLLLCIGYIIGQLKKKPVTYK